MATAVATPTGNAASKRLEGALRYSKVSLDMTKKPPLNSQIGLILSQIQYGPSGAAFFSFQNSSSSKELLKGEARESTLVKRCDEHFNTPLISEKIEE